ncbi:hypothetical protein E2C01_019166 [Portunus trituberculatus]|uniref:Uncharacterized protein n=1 Tax=Portunus trituberculatus TaxID=210409 RepID=A0A5B7DYB0_PORTR|nr:hypothetical protein [Portunus trituberculatus]
MTSDQVKQCRKGQKRSHRSVFRPNQVQDESRKVTLARYSSGQSKPGQVGGMTQGRSKGQVKEKKPVKGQENQDS